MNSLTRYFTRSLVITACLLTGACAVQPTAESPSAKAFEGSMMQTPLTERYPFLGGSTTGVLDIRPDFECADDQASPLLEDLAPVTVAFIEMDIQDALLELSLTTGVTILMDDSVYGAVTVNFQDKPFTEVLQALLSPGNFAYRIFDSYVYVGSPNPDANSFHLLSSTCVYKPVFIEPRQVADLLTPYYRQYVSFNEGHDFLSITAPASIQARIQRDILTFDQVPQQILLEVSIIEVSEELMQRLGVKWKSRIASSEALQPDSGALDDIYTFSDPTYSRNPLAQALIDSAAAINVNESFEVHAMPSIVTLNGKEANFSSTQTSWLQFSFNSNIAYRETQVNYGVKMTIVPYISKQNQIRLDILNASVSDLTGNYDEEPRLISHAISSSVLMMNDETLVLGGLLQKKKRNENGRVPGASGTPLLGGLFRSQAREETTTEVLIVIRPKILNGHAA